MQREKIREYHAGESRDAIAKTWKGIHRSRDDLAKRLSTRSLISLHQSIGYEGGGNLLSTKPTCGESLSTLIASTFPYLSSHSPLTSSVRSLSQSRSVSLVTGLVMKSPP